MQNVRFSTAIRGYDRDEVHRYMSKVNILLAELQITAAPEYAIEAALDSVQDERRSVIAGAEQEAEEITRRSRAQADDRLEEAKREAERLREAAAQEASGTLAGAETRIRALQAHVTRCRSAATARSRSSWSSLGSSTSCWSETARTAAGPQGEGRSKTRRAFPSRNSARVSESSPSEWSSSSATFGAIIG